VEENNDGAGAGNVEFFRDVKKNPTFAIGLIFPVDASGSCA